MSSMASATTPAKPEDTSISSLMVSEASEGCGVVAGAIELLGGWGNGEAIDNHRTHSLGRN